MTDFDALFDKHGSDKGTARHRYGSLYGEITDGREIGRVLEIGVYEGASLLAWAEAWPAATVYGVDVTTQYLKEECEAHPRIFVEQGDATQSVILDARPVLREQFYDLIVDDGDHSCDSQLRALDVFRPLLAPGGAYVVEDVAAEHAARAIVVRMADLGLLSSIRLGPVPDRYDNCLVVGFAP